MITYILRAFSQTLPDSDVNVDVQFVQDEPYVSSSIACAPIPDKDIGSGDGAWTSAELLAAVCKATGQDVQIAPSL